MAELNKFQDVSVTVVGEPKKDGDLVKLIRRLGIGHCIHFTGRISNGEFVRQYARATAAVVPSVYEGFGLPVGEAMACGVRSSAPQVVPCPKLWGMRVFWSSRQIPGPWPGPFGTFSTTRCGPKNWVWPDTGGFTSILPGKRQLKKPYLLTGR